MKYFRYPMNIIKSLLYDIYYFLTESLACRATASSYKSYKAAKRYPDFLKHGNALSAVIPLANKHCRGHGIDIGAGRWPLPGARGIDDSEHENAYAINEPDGSLDYIFSSHTLEHLERPDTALAEWCRKLRKGGIMFLYLPHPACEMWLPENLKFHKWSPSPAELEQKLTNQFNLKISYISYLPDACFSFVVIAEK